MVALGEFQLYLDSILSSSQENRDWQDQYIQTLVELPSHAQTCELSQTAPEERYKERREQLTVVEGLRKYALEQVLLVGKPGSGKSTALRRLLLEEAERCMQAIKQNKNEIPLIPILIELGSLGDSVLAAIEKKLKLWLDLDEKTLISLLRNRQVLVILDGLNELPDTSWKAVGEFKQTCLELKVPLVLTTRELDADSGLGINRKLKMLPLTKPQMERFIHKRLPEIGRRLLQQIQGQLRELVETPLFLRMLCEVFAERGEVPRNRGDLFRKEFRRRYKEFKPERLRNVSSDSRRFTFDLLCHLGFKMVQGKPHTDPLKPSTAQITIPKAQAVTILATFLAGDSALTFEHKKIANEWLEDLVEYDLLEFIRDSKQSDNDSELIKFQHQLFQEYYAAEWLLTLKITDYQLKHDYLNYQKWTETIAFYAALLDDEKLAIRIVELALDIDLKLGARLASEVRPDFKQSAIDLIIQKQLPERIEACLLGITRSDVAIPHLKRALNEASKLFDKSYRVSLADSLEGIDAKCIIDYPQLYKGWDEDAEIRSCIASALGEIGTKRAINLILEALNNEQDDGQVYEALITALGHTRDENVCDVIIPELQSYYNPNIQKAAIRALSNFSNENVVLALMSTLNEQSQAIRYCAADVLGKIGSEISIPRLIDLAIHDEDLAVRRAAIRGLKQVDGGQPLTNWSNALKESDARIRENAAQALGEYGDEEVVPYLINALNDEDSDVRLAAVYALGELSSEKAISNLSETSLQDHDIGVKFASIWSLGRLGEKAIPALTQHLSSENIEIRQKVTEALEKIGSEEVIPILEGILVENIDNCVGWFADHALTETKAKLDGAEEELLRQSREECDRWNNFYHGPEKLSELHELMKQSAASEQLLEVITWYQERHQFYNYEIAQSSALKLQNASSALYFFKVLLTGGIESLKVLCPPAGIPIEMVRRHFEVMQEPHNQLR